MKTFLFLTLSVFFLNLTYLHAQDTVINRYAAINSYDGFCNNAFQVDSTNGFFAGDTVLMIQMKGAVLDTTNTASFGNVLDYRSAGNYEYNVVKSVSGNTIRLKYKLRRSFEIPGGKVQLVKVASFSSYTTTKTLTAMQWNGRKGGVFAINVANTLTLNHPIDVTGKGFAGGSTLVRNSMTFICNAPNYYYPANVDSGAMKGEGFATVGAGKTYGKGKLGNGGGGGNSTNAGGGGGSNAGSAGNGGNQWANCSPVTGASGIGGLGTIFSNASNKIFLGGGGGAGHMNDSTNVAGGNGGGLVFIKAGAINVQSTGAVRVNGAPGRACTVLGTTTFACADGMGGGGGGGGVLLDVNSFTNNISVSANGGKGADMIFVPGGAAIHGPGGGGGGGFIWVTQANMPANVAGTITAGANGLTTYNGSAYGATPGASGQQLSALSFTYPAIADTFPSNSAATPIVTISANPGVNVASGQTVTFTAIAVNAGTSPIWQWRKNGINIPGAVSSTYTTNAIMDGDVFSVLLRSSDTCATLDSVVSNGLTMRITKAAVGNISSLADLFLFPNPNSGTFTVSGILQGCSSFRYRIINTIGQTIHAGTIGVKNSMLKETIVLPEGIPTGTYILQGTGEGFKITKKFTVGIQSR